MNSNQMQKAIDKLKAEGSELSKGAATRLRQMENAIGDLRAKEERKAKLRSYGESVVETAHREPVDKGLEGAVWVNFFNRYCDPKGIAKANVADAPTSSTKKERSSGAGTFSFNNRTVVLAGKVPSNQFIKSSLAEVPFTPSESRKRKAKASSKTRSLVNMIPGFTFGLAKAMEFINAAESNRLIQTYGEKRAARLERKLPAIRLAVAQVQAVA